MHQVRALERHRFDPSVKSVQIKKKKKKKKNLQEDNFKYLESGSIRLKGFNNLFISFCAFKKWGNYLLPSSLFEEENIFLKVVSLLILCQF